MKRPGRPMFRVVLLLLACATAGAIVNVAVAWAMVSSKADQTQLDGWFHWQADNEDWMIDVARGTGVQQVFACRSVMSLPAHSGCDVDLADIPAWSRFHVDGTARPDPFTIWYELATGYPALSMFSREEISPRPQDARRVFGVEFNGETRPIRVLWPGFAINTVFYAAVLWMLFAAPFALRKRRRIKRGLCPKCAYDLRGSADASACPECGTAVK